DVGCRQYSRKRPVVAGRDTEWERLLEAPGGRVSPELPEQWLDRACGQTKPGGSLDLLLETLCLGQEVERPERREPRRHPCRNGRAPHWQQGGDDHSLLRWIKLASS